jgi:alkanesulfonate monooxygenase SsuD/methylene tetrahydromethanopterin reductase-like flavin-dependent oxidoreductase (luciferase family)
MRRYTFIGDGQKVLEELTQFQEHTQLDEIMVTSHIFDPLARIHSYEILKDALQ